jgi:hypothetical protein
VGVIGLEGITLLVYHQDGARSLCKVESVLGKTYAAAGESILLTLGEIRSLKVDIILITLKLTAPQATEINVHLTVGVIAEGAHVDAVTTCYGSGIGDERALRTLCDGCTPVEYVIAVLHGEIHDVALYFLTESHALSLFLGIGGNLDFILLDVAVPQLAAGPWNILQTDYLTVVYNLTVHDVICGKDVIILHDVLVTVVILDILAFPVM